MGFTFCCWAVAGGAAFPLDGSGAEAEAEAEAEALVEVEVDVEEEEEERAGAGTGESAGGRHKPVAAACATLLVVAAFCCW